MGLFGPNYKKINKMINERVNQNAARGRSLGLTCSNCGYYNKITGVCSRVNRKKDSSFSCANHTGA